jgi:RNA polymerase sigma factor (TIGR02999 family)
MPAMRSHASARVQEQSSTPGPPAADPGPTGDAGQASREALDRDYTRLYEELRVLARRQLRRTPAAYTLCTTGLVHESYLKLADLPGGEWRSRGQFFALASRAMRHLLIDHARGRGAKKRGGGALQVTLHPELASADSSTVDLLALDEALSRLGQLSARMERIVECRFFGGLSIAETAEALEISVRTVEREWTRARAYLFRWLAPDAE